MGEADNNLTLEAQELIITEKSKKYLKDTSNWTTIYAVIMFVGIAFMCFSGILLIITNNFMQNNSQMAIPISISTFGFIYIIMALILLIPAVYLYQFGQKIPKAINRNDSIMLESAIGNMKSFWKTLVILVILSIGLSIMMIPFLVVMLMKMGTIPT